MQFASKLDNRVYNYVHPEFIAITTDMSLEVSVLMEYYGLNAFL